MTTCPANEKAPEDAEGTKKLTTTDSLSFSGTTNPRHLRAILELMYRRDVRREQLDCVTGASNSPEVVAELRRRGLDIPCERIDGIDRDGRACFTGQYWLTAADYKKIGEWIDRSPQFKV